MTLSMTMGRGKTTTGLSGYNVYLRFIEEGVASRGTLFFVAGWLRHADEAVFSPPGPGLQAMKKGADS